MANIYNFSRNALLKRIGLSPGKKLLVFLLSLVAITIPMGTVYNSVSVILFVLISVLSVRRQDISFSTALVMPLVLYGIMALSVIWSIDTKSSLMALSKEASLLFIPLAFILNRHLNFRCVQDVLKNYSIAMCLFAIYFLVRAFVRYWSGGSTDVFFYHELATEKINAIYLSAIFSLAFFVFLSKRNKTLAGHIATLFLLVMIFLLSSKNIIIIDVLLTVAYYLFFSGLGKKAIAAALLGLCLLAVGLGYYGRVYDRISQELKPRETEVAGVHNVTINEAWNNTTFTQNDYFNGTAFRVYQARIFTEMVQEEPVFFTGYGLNASSAKVEKKGEEHKLYHQNNEKINYNKLNFHNQYVEVFADLGFFGFVALIVILALNLKNAVKSKYFVHIAFAVLMISLFLTESFLWRQRGVVFFILFYCLFNDLYNGHTKRT